MKTYKNISNKLGIEDEYEDCDKNMPFAIARTEKIVNVLPNKQVEDEVVDYNRARGTLHDVLSKGSVALDGMLEVAKGSEHPRAYEVVATLMKTMADTSKDLYEIQEKSRKIREMDNPEYKKTEGNTINVDKGIFVGTSADLLKHIKDDKNSE